MRYITIRTICAFFIGILLIIWPMSSAILLSSALGIIFFVSSIWLIISYYIKNIRDKEKKYPIFEIIIALLGFYMIIFPSFFINILMYVIASILIISGILQVINIRDAKLWHDMPIKIYVIPVVIIMVGIIVILNPMITVSLSLIVLGVISILYSIFEIIYSIKIKKLKDKYES